MFALLTTVFLFLLFFVAKLLWGRAKDAENRRLEKTFVKENPNFNEHIKTIQNHRRETESSAAKNATLVAGGVAAGALLGHALSRDEHNQTQVQELQNATVWSTEDGREDGSYDEDVAQDVLAADEQDPHDGYDNYDASSDFDDAYDDDDDGED